MKKVLIAIIFIFLVKYAAAQQIPKEQVPAVVLNTFQTKFPNTKETKWEVKDGVYKAECEIESREHELWIDKNGSVK